MTKVKAIISFSAYGIHARPGQEFEIVDKEQRLDLERLGWIQPMEYEVTTEVSEDSKVKETKKATKKAKE